MVREVLTGSQVIDHFPAFEDDGFTKRSGLLPFDFTVTSFQDDAQSSLPVTVSEIGTTGEYKVAFTPSADAYYELQVMVNFSKEIWHGTYQSVAELTNTLAEDARNRSMRLDAAPIVSPVADNSLADQILNKDSSKTYNPATDSLEAIADALTSSSAATSSTLSQMQVDLSRVLGLLHRNSMLDKQQYDSNQQLTFARLRVFDTAANIPATPGGSETVGLLHEYEISAEYAGLNQVTKFTLKQIL